MTALIKYSGSCHCSAIKFEVLAPRELPVVVCNCTVCTKKQSRHFTVPSSHFKLVTGHTSMTTYTFGTHQAKHMFCCKCGVQSFFIPQSNPDMMAIMPHSLDGPLPLKIRLENADGHSWHESIKNSDTRDKTKL